MKRNLFRVLVGSTLAVSACFDDVGNPDSADTQAHDSGTETSSGTTGTTDNGDNTTGTASNVTTTAAEASGSGDTAPDTTTAAEASGSSSTAPNTTTAAEESGSGGTMSWTSTTAEESGSGGTDTDTGECVPRTRDCPSFCEQHNGAEVVFCEDFEQSSDASAWPLKYLDSCSYEVISGEGRNGSRGLSIGLPQAGPLCGLADSLSTRSVTDSRYEVSFDFAVRRASDGNVVVGSVSFITSDGMGKWYGLASRAGQLDGAAYFATVESPPMPPDVPEEPEEWHTVVIVFERIDTTASFSSTLSVDGTLVETSTRDLSPEGTGWQIQLGNWFVGALPEPHVGTFDISYDNVLVRRY